MRCIQATRLILTHYKEKTMLGFYNILSDEEIAAIHEASLELMETVGMCIDHEEVLKELADKGVRVDLDKQRAYFSAGQVARALDNIPSDFLYGARNPEHNIRVGAGKAPFCRALGGAPEAFDVFTGESRPLTPEDGADLARLIDGLDNLNTMTTPSLSGFPVHTYDIHTLATFLANTEKHLSALTVDSKNLKYELEMVEMVAGSRAALKAAPLIDGIVTMIDPFFMPGDEVERLRLYGEYGIPVHLVNVPITGATAPYTVAGTIAEINTEFLMGSTLIDFLTPGLPHFYFFLPKAMDMRTAGITGACIPENQMIMAAVAQMARHYKVPSCVSAGSGACCQTHQFMHQYGSAVNLAMLSGASEVNGLGQLGGSMQCSQEMLVVADEATGFARHLMQGFDLTRESMGLDAMDRVGIKGNFLGDPHTFEYLRKEVKYTPGIFQWTDHGKWSDDGRPSLLDRARDKAAAILKDHRPEPLDPGVQKEIRQLLDSADRELDPS